MALSSNQYKAQFLASEDAQTVRLELERMMESAQYSTHTFYTPADATQSFVDKHLHYLSEHPKLKATEYLSNLRLMTKVR